MPTWGTRVLADSNTTCAPSLTIAISLIQAIKYTKPKKMRTYFGKFSFITISSIRDKISYGPTQSSYILHHIHSWFCSSRKYQTIFHEYR